MNDKIKGLVERLNAECDRLIKELGDPNVRPIQALARQAAAALTLTDEARVRAERDAAMLRYRVESRDAAAIPMAQALSASEALVRELVEGLRDARNDLFRCHDWIAEETRVTRRITLAAEMVGRADALILRAENHGSSRADNAASDAARPDCSAAQSLDGRGEL